jgi:hypothetical protein
MTCNVCEGTGYKNLHQVPDEVLKQFDHTGDNQIILDWIKLNINHDVSVCTCCGDGENWYGEPGQHYNTPQDRRGIDGVYGYNGGLAECN